MDARNRIAKRIAKEISRGDVVNCGIGIPTLVPNYVPQDLGVTFHSENGVLGVGPSPPLAEADPDISNASVYPITLIPGAAVFDSVTAFAMIRSGAVTMAILGAIQVDQKGDLANWTIPGQLPIGMGGAMDLATGAKRVIAATEHCNKDGSPKILKRCTYPLTAKGKVNLIVTEKAVMEVKPEGLLLREVAADTTVEDVLNLTDADLIVGDDCRVAEDF